MNALLEIILETHAYLFQTCLYFYLHVRYCILKPYYKKIADISSDPAFIYLVMVKYEEYMRDYYPNNPDAALFSPYEYYYIFKRHYNDAIDFYRKAFYYLTEDFSPIYHFCAHHFSMFTISYDDVGDGMSTIITPEDLIQLTVAVYLTKSHRTPHYISFLKQKARYDSIKSILNCRSEFKSRELKYRKLSPEEIDQVASGQGVEYGIHYTFIEISPIENVKTA